MKFCVLLCVLGALVVSTTAQDESTSAFTLPKELHPFPCYQPAETGFCKAAFRRYFYNRHTRKCELFTYGGCGGNQNNFQTKHECEAECIPRPVDVCRLKPDVGPCDAAFTKWFYNFKTKQCETFSYGGCKGNNNRFDTKRQCEAACVRRPVDVCGLKPDSGPCKAAIPRWFFNKAKGECQQFIYGGCQGNKNNFETRKECQNACRKDCVPVNCFANPCEVIKCEAFPHADCVPNFCNGCGADFFVSGRLVDCKKKPNPPLCVPEGRQCRRNLHIAATDAAIGAVYYPPCCKGTVCCTCGPPVVTQYTPVPLFGTCQKRCFCPLG